MRKAKPKTQRYLITIKVWVRDGEKPELRTLCGDTMFLSMTEGMRASSYIRKVNKFSTAAVQTNEKEKTVTKQARLRSEARQAAEFRGHTLSAFRKVSEVSSMAECIACGKYVQVTTKPAPNDIDVSGSAVALNCDSYGRR